MPPRARTARRADRTALARLCRAAVGPHDYVLSYLDEMIAGREARVVETEGRIVAMAGITVCADGALWLGQLRTHPRFRRRGYATMLLDDAFARVVRERRPSLRLWTSRRNRVGRALFERNGFRSITVFTRMTAPPMPAPARAAPPAGRTRNRKIAAATLWRRWRHSAANRDSRGYVDYRWHFLPASPQVFEVMRRRHEVHTRRNAACVAWTDDEDTALYGSIIAGGREALLLMRQMATVMGRERVEVFLPKRSRLVRAARRAGFEQAAWGGAAVLYERANPLITMGVA